MDSALESCAHDVEEMSNENILLRSQSTTDEVRYHSAKEARGATMLKLSLDHDETQCSGKKNCVYTIIVLSDAYVEYQIEVKTVQNNH